MTAVPWTTLRTPAFEWMSRPSETSRPPLPGEGTNRTTAVAPRARVASTRRRTKLTSDRTPVRPARERLLRVAHAARVDVGRPKDGQPAARKPRRAQARQARPVALPTVTDEEREARSAGAPRDDLAPVGDVERERLRAVEAQRICEREVVRAGGRQRPAAAPERIPERREQRPDCRIGGSPR